ncbi:uncharacterized protein NPIL_367091 [Nephila pilipes]|uniref:C2H2-type domain-containing protein n=1 Tax=Nephila pilipes TaxID=299642 RepID=A0A8X6T4G2_NEPPI|nr:uncharacterized protein NPIL_367091 [Nephila pilipes]
MSTQKSENKRPFSGPKERSVCNTCGVTFGAKKSLYKHTRKFHPEESQPISNKLICGMCGEKFSGVSNPTSNRIRHAKASGSVKCGFACPALMTVSRRSINGVTEITVQYQSVHVGHDMEPGKLHLTKDERWALASSLEQDDATSVKLMVKNMQDSPHDPVLIFKPVGDEMNGYKKIGTEEFMLAIMNDDQEKLLELYGKQCVMIDSTHGTNEYGFQMTTLMVQDENHQGMPVAILFSSRVATEILVPFFGAIKKKVPGFKTNFLLSDDTNSFPNAWREVFEDETKHLLCAWHVMRNWNLNINSKVIQCKKEIRIKLKNFLTETDETSFHKLISSFIETYEAKESVLLHTSRIITSAEQKNGLLVIKKKAGVNTNMKLERWHRQIKYEEAGGTVMKRMDKTISLILKAIAKKLLSRIISIERRKLTPRVALIRKRHKTSLEWGVNMESRVGETSVETRREDLEHSNHSLVVDENYNEKHEIEKDAIVATLHNVSLDAEIHNTLTVMKILERGLKNVKSVDEVCEIKRTLIALEKE